MRRNSPIVPSKKSIRSSQKKHSFSEKLDADPRLGVAPRHVDVIYPPKGSDRTGPVFMAKIYSLLDTPGAELMSISCLDKKRDLEFEMRFDERFPVPMWFKTMSDEQRVAYARDQIARFGGFEKLSEIFRSVFPKLSI